MQFRDHADLPHFPVDRWAPRSLKPGLNSARKAGSHSPQIRTPDILGPVLHSISGSLLLTAWRLLLHKDSAHGCTTGLLPFGDLAFTEPSGKERSDLSSARFDRLMAGHRGFPRCRLSSLHMVAQDFAFKVGRNVQDGLCSRNGLITQSCERAVEGSG
jgi:hypothetical protein